MLIKQADDQSAFILELERLVTGIGTEAKRPAEDLRIRKAGDKGDREAAYLIDFEFAPHWAAIHDLRLEHSGRVEQIGDLLSHRWINIYLIDTRHFHAGLKTTEQGAGRSQYFKLPMASSANRAHQRTAMNRIDDLANSR